MEKGTAPAWQARNIARKKVLDPIKQTIVDREDAFDNQLDLYRLVLRLVDLKLSSGTLLQSTLYLFPGIQWRTRHSVFKILTAADTTILGFQRAPEEGLALWAMLLEWSVMEIVNTHLSAIQSLEVRNSRLIYGTAHPMDEVPIE